MGVDNAMGRSLPGSAGALSTSTSFAIAAVAISSSNSATSVTAPLRIVSHAFRFVPSSFPYFHHLQISSYLYRWVHTRTSTVLTTDRGGRKSQAWRGALTTIKDKQRQRT